MNVFMLTNAVAPDQLGGLERYVRELSAALVRQGVSVTVLAKQVRREDPVEEIGSDGVTIVRHRVPEKTSRLFAALYPVRPFPIVRRLLKRDRVAVVHAHFPIPALPLALGRRPYVYTFHNPVHREILRERQGTYALPKLLQWTAVAGLRGVERVIVARAAGLIVLSEFSRSEIAALSPGAAGNALLLPGGLNLERFSPGGPVGGHPWPGEGPLLFAARRLTPRTGVQELIAAMPVIRAAVPGTRLAIAGSGHMKQELRKRIHALGLDESARLVGWLSDEPLIRWYRAADLVVMPTQELESFGLSTAEALACGTPVVGTPAGGTQEILAPLHPDLVTADTSAEALASTVIAWLRRPDLLAGISLRARERVSGMGWSAIAAAHIEYYGRIGGATLSR
jgi:glycosyltransferase involved in cell wall biosynthesis